MTFMIKYFEKVWRYFLVLRKFFALLIIAVMSFPLVNISAADTNLIPEADCKMNKGNNWAPYTGGKVSVVSLKTATDSKNTVLKATDLGKNTWETPFLEIFAIIKDDVDKNGAGRYKVSFEYMFQGEEDKDYNITTMIRSTRPMKVLTKKNNDSTQFRDSMGRISGKTGVWRTFNTTFGVVEEDVQNANTSWMFCFDGFPTDLTTMYFDDFVITRTAVKDITDVSVKGTVVSNSVKFKGAQTITDKNESSENTGNVQHCVNLLDKKTSTFDNIKTVEESGWTGFSSVDLSIVQGGYKESCLKMTTPKQTWGSPTIDIFPYIKEAGTYSLSMFVKFDGDTEQNLALILRGTRENSFIEERGGNFYGIISTKNVQAGQWTRITAQFTVSENDISADSWKLCFSTIKPEIKAIYVDEVVLIKGETDQLPENNEPDEAIVVADGTLKQNDGSLYNPQIKKVAITTSVVTIVVVAVTIALKIIIPKIFKKGEEKLKKRSPQ